MASVTPDLRLPSWPQSIRLVPNCSVTASGWQWSFP